MNDMIFVFGKYRRRIFLFIFLSFSFQPDYTLAEIGETLTLNTNIGLMTFPIIVRIPQRVLATCYQTIPRPGWELRVYWLCLCSAAIILLYIITVAVYDARRLFNDVNKIDFFIRISMNCFILVYGSSRTT
jgi:hypothetical protein